MKRILLALGTILLLLTAAGGSALAQTEPLRLFFLHHSTGRHLINAGEVRSELDVLNLQRGQQAVLWDHDYNYIGLTGPDGELLGYDYAIPEDNTDPIGLHLLWTTENSARDSILARFDVIAFKSCYPVSDITTDDKLLQYQTWYLEIRDVLDQHLDKQFVLMSTPPLLPSATSPEAADRARAFADWMGSAAYLDGHPNLHFFDFFDRLAVPDDGSATRNTLRPEYQMDPATTSYPNDLANQLIGPQWLDALLAAGATRASAAPVPQAVASLVGNHPNPFNPSTTIAFVLDHAQTVSLDIYNVQGRLVRRLAAAEYPAGDHQVVWDGRDGAGRPQPSGVFFCRLGTPAGQSVAKMTLAK